MAWKVNKKVADVAQEGLALCLWFTPKRWPRCRAPHFGPSSSFSCCWQSDWTARLPARRPWSPGSVMKCRCLRSTARSSWPASSPSTSSPPVLPLAHRYTKFTNSHVPIPQAIKFITVLRRQTIRDYNKPPDAFVERALPMPCANSMNVCRVTDIHPISTITLKNGGKNSEKLPKPRMIFLLKLLL